MSRASKNDFYWNTNGMIYKLCGTHKIYKSRCFDVIFNTIFWQNLLMQFFWRIFFFDTMFRHNFFDAKFFRQIFFDAIFFFYNLLSILSFTIRVPSILFFLTSDQHEVENVKPWYFKIWRYPLQDLSNEGSKLMNLLSFDLGHWGRKNWPCSYLWHA